MNDLGWEVALSDSSYVETPLAPFITRVDTTVGDPAAPWSARAIASPTTRFPEPFVSVHCFLGHRGLVRGTFTHAPFTVAGAVADVTIGDGPIWRALGGESGIKPALFFRFDWMGTTEIVHEE